MGPLRVGFFYGAIAALVALFAGFFFFILSPSGTPEWLLSVTADFLPLFAVAAYLFLAILAALRARPTHIVSDAPYRSQVMRDAALAAVIVALMAGVVNIIVTALQATLFADDIRNWASQAAPHIVRYVNGVGAGLHDPPPPTSVAQVERVLQPPSLGNLGRSIGNLAVGAIFVGAIGAFIGALRGRAHPEQAPEASK